ncbi:hypothetical protein GCM10027073_64840 [Streptomyces chlorus]|uniref:Uncharacterized protein n=1 Tax=Streptomyces chlorus TaxID=887452 RepID=A0ABW1E3I4_9ACTN
MVAPQVPLDDVDLYAVDAEDAAALADSGELLAVWDGKPARGFGGTADVVSYAERSGTPVRVLWPEGATR